MNLNRAPRPFEILSEMTPKGDQPRAIDELVEGLKQRKRYQTLLGVTGSGKTFTIANVIERWGRPTLVISHNKTLAAQLYSELREFFPNNAVEYFVSYYDYYQPEAYIPQRDIYIEKDASINNDLDRLRLAATSALVSREDVIIVSSVSCLYGLGSPEEYKEMFVPISRGEERDRDAFLRDLVSIQYSRSQIDLERGTFRARGDVVEIHPAYEETAYRIEFFGDEVEEIFEINTKTGEIVAELEFLTILPAKHFVASEERIEKASHTIKQELTEQLGAIQDEGKLLEAERLNTRTRYDLELLKEVGYCPGIENYSRHFTGRKPGERPYSLLDYFPDDFLVVVDESHVTNPQIRGMYHADRSRKETLVKHGFRLPSALDNRPMRFEEWESLVGPAIFVSATPGPYELDQTQGEIVEQIIRPTGLLDPIVEVRTAKGQVPDLITEIKKRIELDERVLVTTLTKRMAEDLDEYFQEQGISCSYLHSEVQTFDRVEILKDLRQGRYNVVVGVNLLREGLDLPEVSLVAILDADKEGFLRSETSLIQTIGRAARNVNARVILYADSITDSMDRAMKETSRRRKIQEAYNIEHNIEPTTVVKSIRAGIDEAVRAQKVIRESVHEGDEEFSLRERMSDLESKMLEAAEQLQFERAAELRDQITELKTKLGTIKK